ncbi:hypothetical protein F5880DRAFT_1615678 [Lentinula raphanica]|nr:hypothetical protein F5880DRAFT_1615678 [Lentinula raphanica]
MEECLRTFENSPDLLDQFQVASAAFFLVQKVAHDTRDRGEEVYFETLRAKTALQYVSLVTLFSSAADSYGLWVFPPQVLLQSPATNPITVSAPSPNVPTSNSNRVPPRKDAPVRFPPSMPVEDMFSWDQVDRAQPIRVTAHQVLQWKENPDSLPQQQMFIAEIEGNEEPFKVVASLGIHEDR